MWSISRNWLFAHALTPQVGYRASTARRSLTGIVRFGDETAVTSSPSRTRTATEASSSIARAVVTGTGPTRSISQRSPRLTCPRESAALSTVTRTSTGLHGPSLAGATRVAEDPVDVGVPGRAEPSAGVGRQARLEAVRAVGIRPLVRTAIHIQPARPRLVVGFGAGAHLPTSIAQPLHTRRAGGLEELSLGRRVRHSGRRDLRRLYVGELPGAERRIGLGQLLERTRRVERPSGRTDGRPSGLGNPMSRAPMPALAPDLRLLDTARQAGLDRRAQPLGAGGVVEELCGTLAFERTRNQLLRDLLELSEHP